MALTKLFIFNNFSCFSSVKGLDLAVLRKQEKENLPEFLKRIGHDYDVIYFEDCCSKDIPAIEKDVTMTISHGTPLDQRICFQASHVMASSSYLFNCRYIPCSPGNIFKNLRQERCRKVAIFSRLCKVSYDYLRQVCELLSVSKIDAYVPRTDPDGSIDSRIYDIIDVKQPVKRNNINDVYNMYEFVVIPEVECLSLPLREALLCGCTPILSHDILYKSYTYFNDCYKFIVFTNYDKQTISMIQEYISSDRGMKEIESRFSFTRMIYEMMNFVSSSLLVDVKWLPKQEKPKFISVPTFLANVISSAPPINRSGRCFIHQTLESANKRKKNSEEYYDIGVNWDSIEI